MKRKQSSKESLNQQHKLQTKRNKNGQFKCSKNNDELSRLVEWLSTTNGCEGEPAVGPK